jgi:hypothetical protein
MYFSRILPLEFLKPYLLFAIIAYVERNFSVRAVIKPTCKAALKETPLRTPTIHENGGRNIDISEAKYLYGMKRL